MKRIVLGAAAMLCSLGAVAQEEKDDFTRFLQEQEAGFDKFVDDATKDFINFMRNPWKEFEAEKPVPKRVKPEPVKPVVYDEKTAPQNPKPVCLSIEEILDLTTSEGKQKPVIHVDDIDNIDFDKPEDIVRKKKEPTVVVIKEKPVDKPVEKPAAQPEKKPVEKKPEPKPVASSPVVTPPVAEPASPVVVPANPSPLQTAQPGRSRIAYAGTTFYLHNELKGKCRLSGLNENAIADAYEALCRSDYQPLMADCMQVKKELQLNDWGLFALIRQVADTYCATANESIVMQQFLLNEMGYKARMARKATGNKMMLFVATDCKIYARPYITLEGRNYYNMSGDNAQCQFYMCPKESPKAKKAVAMRLDAAPNFSGAVTTSTRSAQGSAAKVTVNVSKALAEFYKDYPQCDYSVYFNAPVNSDVESKLVSALAPLIQGKSEAEAANLLINFVQTAFKYQTDDEQFGYEKPFFVEELFYYPYSDCEDRSMLFSYLVRKLMGLDVVLLDYPDHIATAVRFKGNVGGDYLMVNNQKYTVCDPTYIGASIGMTMPMFKNVAAKVLRY